ncbi:hypothetical protein ScPMuIL_009972 [Solemya velum]
MRTLAKILLDFIGSTVEGKLALENWPKNGCCMKEIGQTIRSTSEIRERAMLATGSIVKLKVEEQTVDLLGLTRSGLIIRSQAFQTIMGVAKQPFLDLRCSAYQVIAALALQPWGQRLMNEFPGFNEYILAGQLRKLKKERCEV